MPKGGARARSGPAPDPNALRRLRKDDSSGWTTLPAAGRDAEPPAWPLSGQSDREAELWERFWHKPQAFVWERDNLTELVALFVRQLTEAEGQKASAENRKTVRMMFADLYLTPDSLARARLRIEDAAPETQTSSTPKRSSTRNRLTVVKNGD